MKRDQEREEKARRERQKALDKESGFFLPDQEVPADQEQLAQMLDTDSANEEEEGAEGEPSERPSVDRLQREGVANTARVQVQGDLRSETVDCGELLLRKGDHIVVEGDRGQAMAQVLESTMRQVVMDRRLRKALREFDAGDRRQEARNRRRAREAYGVGRERISKRNLPDRKSVV